MISKSATKNGRIDKWDNAKAGLILLVIFGHLVEPFCDNCSIFRAAFFFTYSFHMPAFIFISGLMGKRVVEKLDKDKLIPLLFISFLLQFLRFFVSYISNRDIQFNLFNQTTIAWYLFALVAFYIIAHLLKDFSQVYVLAVAIILAAIIGYDRNIGSMFALSRIFIYFPFFFAGYIIDEQRLRKFLMTTGIRSLSVLTMLGYIILCISKIDNFYQWRPLLSGLNHYYLLKPPIDPFYGGVYRLVYYLLLVLIICAFLGVVPNVHLPIFSSIGRETLSIYFWHLLFFQLIRDFTPYMEIMTQIGAKSIFIMIPLSFVLALIFTLPPFTSVIRLLLNPQRTSKMIKERDKARNNV